MKQNLANKISVVKPGLLAIDGELSFATVKSLSVEIQSLLPTLQKSCAVDLSDIGQCDSAGLAFLIECKRYALRNKQIIKFLHIPRQLIDIASVSNVNDILQG